MKQSLNSLIRTIGQIEAYKDSLVKAGENLKQVLLSENFDTKEIDWHLGACCDDIDRKIQTLEVDVIEEERGRK